MSKGVGKARKRRSKEKECQESREKEVNGGETIPRLTLFRSFIDCINGYMQVQFIRTMTALLKF